MASNESQTRVTRRQIIRDGETVLNPGGRLGEEVAAHFLEGDERTIRFLGHTLGTMFTPLVYSLMSIQPQEPLAPPQSITLEALHKQTLKEFEEQKQTIAQASFPTPTQDTHSLGDTIGNAFVGAGLLGAPLAAGALFGPRAGLGVALAEIAGAVACGPAVPPTPEPTPTPEPPPTPIPFTFNASTENNTLTIQFHNQKTVGMGGYESMPLGSLATNTSLSAGLTLRDVFPTVKNPELFRAAALLLEPPSDHVRKDAKNNALPSYRVDGTAYIDASIKLNKHQLAGTRGSTIINSLKVPKDQKKDLLTSQVKRNEELFTIIFDMLNNLKGSFKGGSTQEKQVVALYKLMKDMIMEDSIKTVDKDALNLFLNLCFNQGESVRDIVDVTNNPLFRLWARDPQSNLPTLELKNHFLRLFFALPQNAIKELFEGVDGRDPNNGEMRRYGMSAGQRNTFYDFVLPFAKDGSSVVFDTDKLVDMVLTLPVDVSSGTPEAKKHLETLVQIIKNINAIDTKKASDLYCALPKTSRDAVRRKLFSDHKWEGNDGFIMAQWINNLFIPIKNGVQMSADGKTEIKGVTGYDTRSEPFLKLIMEDLFTDEKQGGYDLALIMTNLSRNTHESDLSRLQSLWMLLHDMESLYRQSGPLRTTCSKALRELAYIAVSSQKSNTSGSMRWEASNAAKAFMAALSLPLSIRNNLLTAQHLEPFVDATISDNPQRKVLAYITPEGVFRPLAGPLPSKNNIRLVFNRFTPDQIAALYNWFDQVDNFQTESVKGLSIYNSFREKSLTFSPLSYLFLTSPVPGLDLTADINRPMNVFKEPSPLLMGYVKYLTQHWDALKQLAVTSPSVKEALTSIQTNMKGFAPTTANQWNKLTGQVEIPENHAIRFVQKLDWITRQPFEFSAPLLNVLPSEVASLLIDRLPNQDYANLNGLALRYLFYTLITKPEIIDPVFGKIEPANLSSYQQDLFRASPNLRGLLSIAAQEITPQEIAVVLKQMVGMENSDYAKVAENMHRLVFSRMTKGKLIMLGNYQGLGWDPEIHFGGDKKSLSTFIDLNAADITVLEINQRGAKVKVSPTKGMRLVNKFPDVVKGPGPWTGNATSWSVFAENIIKGEPIQVTFDPKLATQPQLLVQDIRTTRPDDKSPENVTSIHLPWGVVPGAYALLRSEGIQYSIGIQKNQEIAIKIQGQAGWTPGVLNPKQSASNSLSASEMIGNRIFYNETDDQYWIEATVNQDRKQILIQMTLSDFFSKGITFDEIRKMSNNQRLTLEIAAVIGLMVATAWGANLAMDAAAARLAPILLRADSFLQNLYELSKIIYSLIPKFLLKPISDLTPQQQQELQTKLGTHMTRDEVDDILQRLYTDPALTVQEALNNAFADMIAKIDNTQADLFQSVSQAAQASSQPTQTIAQNIAAPVTSVYNDFQTATTAVNQILEGVVSDMAGAMQVASGTPTAQLPVAV